MKTVDIESPVFPGKQITITLSAVSESETPEGLHTLTIKHTLPNGRVREMAVHYTGEMDDNLLDVHGKCAVDALLSAMVPEFISEEYARRGYNQDELRSLRYQLSEKYTPKT